MQKVALIIRHVTIGLVIAVAVVLIIDMFINNAMCLTDRRVFKLMCLGLCLMAIVTAKLPRE